MGNYLVDPNNCDRDVKITGQVIGDNESNCALQLFANGVLCDTVSLAPLFAKEQDSVEGVDMLAWLQNTCSLQWTPQGEPSQTWNIYEDIKNKLPIDLDFDVDTCALKFTNLMGSCQTWNLIDALRAKLPTYRTAYDADTHTLDFLCGPNTIESHVLNCGQFSFDPATCFLSYTNAKKQTQGFFIPQDQFAYNQESCTLTILPAKAGQAPVIIPTGATVADVHFGTTPNCDGCSLRFTYKSKTVDVALPDMLVGCSFDVATNTLRMIHCSGMETNKVLPKATLQCNTLPDGTQVMVFDNGCPGGQKIFNIPGITLDTDDLTVVGSTLTFTYGGDGNDNVVIVDVCDLVAQNCNATFTAINSDGSWEFVDNAGNSFTYPAPKNCCTYLGINPQVLAGTDPTDPAGNYPNKTDGDTAIECHPNGISFWTCVNGAWDLGFTKTFSNNLHYFSSVNGDIDPHQPPIAPPADPRYATKTDGDTVTVCHNNGLCAYTCVSGTWSLDWCKVFEDCCHYQVNVGTAIVPGTPPIAPPADPRYATKTDGDTVTVCHNNGLCAYTCVSGTWSLDWCKVFEDCCHYQVNVGTAIVPGTPPAAPAISGTKQDGDTLHACHPNGSAYYTCANGAWVLDFIKLDANNCCTYMLESTSTLVEGESTTIVGAPANKSDGDTAVQCHPNGFSTWSCVNGAWQLEWIKIFPDPIIPDEVQISDGQPDKDSGVKVWFNCNDGCVYYCQEDGTWLAPKGCPVPSGQAGIHVAIPAAGEANPAAWITANANNYPAGTNFYTGPVTNPTQVWEMDSAGTPLCQKDNTVPSGQAGIHVAIPAAGEANPAAWITANANNYPAGTNFYTGPVTNPTQVWEMDSAGTPLCQKDNTVPSALAQCFATDEEYAAVNDGACGPEEGMPLGKNAAGKAVSQPPLKCRFHRGAIDAITPLHGSLDAAYADYVAQGNQASIRLAEVCIELDNPTCWPMHYSLDTRINLLLSMVEGNRWNVQINDVPAGAAGGSTGFLGSPWHQTDARDDALSDLTNLYSPGKRVLQPGETQEICVTLGWVPLNYVPSPNNRMVMYGFRLTGCGMNCHEVLPDVNTTGTLLY